jgi:hypothetical protein
LEYTPQELSGVIFYKVRSRDEQIKTEWERTRIQTFYLINIQLDKKNKITYDKFKKDVWPFFWEKRAQNESDIDAVMDIDQWNSILNKSASSTGNLNVEEDIKI